MLSVELECLNKLSTVKLNNWVYKLNILGYIISPNSKEWETITYIRQIKRSNFNSGAPCFRFLDYSFEFVRPLLHFNNSIYLFFPKSFLSILLLSRVNLRYIKSIVAIGGVLSSASWLHTIQISLLAKKLYAKSWNHLFSYINSANFRWCFDINYIQLNLKAIEDIWVSGILPQTRESSNF